MGDPQTSRHVDDLRHRGEINVAITSNEDRLISRADEDLREPPLQCGEVESFLVQEKGAIGPDCDHNRDVCRFAPIGWLWNKRIEAS